MVRGAFFRCRAVCAKVEGAMSKSNLCQRIYTVVCWISAAKSETGSIMQRTVASSTIWVLNRMPLTRNDAIIANVGQHFFPWHDDITPRFARDYVDAARWHASGRWRRESAEHNRNRLVHNISDEGVHFFFREAGPQIWKDGVFPGKRAGTTSKNHECIPPWNYELVQQAYLLPDDAASASTQPSNTLDELLGRRAFDAYNHGLCHLTANSPVDLLRVWLPTALLGSRESFAPMDCTHSTRNGSVLAFWNQMLMHSIWRREARGEGRTSASRSARRIDRSGPSMDQLWQAAKMMITGPAFRYVGYRPEGIDRYDGTHSGGYGDSGGACEMCSSNGTAGSLVAGGGWRGFCRTGYRSDPRLCNDGFLPGQTCPETRLNGRCTKERGPA